MSLPSVLLVHNRYQQRGGEEAVFDAEAALLAGHGHRIERIEFDNLDLPSELSVKEKVTLGFETVWSEPARRRLKRTLDVFKPDIVHFHNTLPRISPAAYSAAKSSGARVVQTLHNFRLICPSGLMYRDGAPCESCAGKLVPLPAIQHGCYRDSRTESAAVAAMLSFHRLRGTYQRDVDVYIAPSDFLRDKVIKAGIEPHKVVVKPNFLDPDPGLGTGGDEFALYVGRLSRAKGIETLIEAYRLNPDLPPLHVAGEGELAPLVRDAAARDSRISYLGRLERDAVLDEMGRAACLVFPSRWYENFPVTIVEAFARGLPVLASRLGAVQSIVREGETGRLFAAGDAGDLASKLLQLFADRESRAWMRLNARDEYLSAYTGQRNYESLLRIYSGLTPVLSLPLKQN